MKLFFVVIFFVLFYFITFIHCNECDCSGNLGWNCGSPPKCTFQCNVGCWCPNNAVFFCPERKTCPALTPTDEQDLSTYNTTATNSISRMMDQINNGGLNANIFFEEFFLEPFRIAFENDQNNYEVFSNIMEQTSPPASGETVLSFLWKSLQTLMGFLPLLSDSKAIGWAVAIDGGIASLQTDLGGQYQYGSTDWNSFLAGKISNSTTYWLEVTNGAQQYVEAFWKQHGLPGEVTKSTKSNKKDLLKNLIQGVWKYLPTQQQAERTLWADYINSSESGLQSSFQTNRDGSFNVWSITRMSDSAEAVQNHLLSISNGCIQPNNFKDRQGHIIGSANFYWNYDGGEDLFGYCNQDNIAILSGDVIYNIGKNQPVMWGCYFTNNGFKFFKDMTFPVTRTPCVGKCLN